MQIGLGLWLGTRQVGGFSPATLFAAGEPGGWYDPSDLSTMFQDSAGTTPVTATGQTVGLMLDKSQGLALGPELLALGAIGLVGTATAASYSTSSGVGSVTRVDASNQSFVRWSGLTTGSFYRIVITNTSANGINVRAGNEGAAFIAVVPAGQAVTMYGVPGSNLITITSGGGTATFTLTSILQVAGNHLTQATAASRPIYGIEPFGGRRNLLVNTGFDGAVSGTPGTPPTNWSYILSGGTTTYTAGAAALGGGTIRLQATNNRQIIFQTSTLAATGTWVLTLPVEVFAATNLANIITFNPQPVGATTTFTYNGVSQTGTFTPPLGSGVLQVVITTTGTGGSLGIRIGIGTGSNATGDVAFSNPQLETGSLATPYQRVTDQWNVTEAGVPSVSYVQYDGTDDWFISPTITPGIDKAQVFAGVRKLSDAAAGMLAESSVNATTQQGAFQLRAPLSASPTYFLSSAGSVYGGQVTVSGFTAPITNVLTGIGDIAADTTILRVNGVQEATSAADQGTGNYLAYPLYVGRRGGTTLPFNGRLYQMIVRFGANLDAATITATETFVNSKTGAYV